MKKSKYVINNEYSYKIVQNLVRTLNEEDYYSGRLKTLISSHKQYKLMYIPINRLITGVYLINDKKVEKYSQMSKETIPPIVLGNEINNGEEFIVDDGNHRVQVMLINNEQEILAFVPIHFTKYFN